MNPRQRVVCLTLLISPAILAAPAAQAGPFEFHSNFWLNLHHFLYQQAVSKAAPAVDLSHDEQTAWDKAVQFYRQSMVPHDLLMDQRMRAIDTELIEDETLPKLVVNGEEGALWGTLNSVAGIYKTYWWSGHDRVNREFIAGALPLVQHYAPQLIQQLTTVYEAAWPKDAIRVDVAEYANWAGAYTYTYGWSRVHEIVSSADAANQGNAALEILFHEATHGFVPFDTGRLATQLATVATSHKVRTPPDLVHIFIFYTAGELTRRDLSAAGISSYVPYADKKHLYQDEWARWHSGIALYWKQHMDGALSLNDAVDKIVGESAKSVR